ncbi:MAG: S8 family serine peptidase [Kangiellaceae bacterium]|nr:S8 family serine peptidase [Kangiellaceae bacterium]
MFKWKNKNNWFQKRKIINQLDWSITGSSAKFSCIRWMLYCAIITSLNVSPLAATNTTRSHGTSTRDTDRNQPQLLNYSPQPCVQADNLMTLSGKSLTNTSFLGDNLSLHLHLEPSSQNFTFEPQLVETQSWTDSTIRVLVPHFLSTSRSQVVVALRIVSGNEWHSEPISVAICATPTTQNDVDSKNPSQSTAEPDTTIEDRPEPKEPKNDEMARRLSHHTSSNSLLSTGLPPLPKSLIIPKRQDNEEFVLNEIIAGSADMDEAKSLAKLMGNFGATLVRRKKLSNLNLVLSTFRLAASAQVLEVITQIKSQQPHTWIDANHFYLSQSANKNTTRSPVKVSGNRKRLFDTIGLKSPNVCKNNLSIGILDGPIDTTALSLKEKSIVQKKMFSRGKKEGISDHATAIASLLIGNTQFPELAGVVSNAQLFVGVVMQQDKQNKKKSVATTENLILGLDWLLKKKVQVINLSLGGPRNVLLEMALVKVLAAKVAVVAAAGNGNSKLEQIFPAAQRGVIAVSAIDFEYFIARESHQGDYIDLTAPGVDIWVASTNGSAHYLSGSSMASPLVAAALAQLGGKPSLAISLFDTARDLGKPGKDSTYGWGGLQFPSCSTK